MEGTNFKKAIQIIVAIGVVAAGLRLALIYQERHESAAKPQPPSSALNADDYVLPAKLHAYDLKSARESLLGKSVWVRTGYGVAYYRYNSATRRADFSKEAGLLGPIEQLQITDVVMNRNPASGAGGWQGPPDARFRIHSDEQQMMAVFKKEGKTFAFPIGTSSNGSYHFFLDELLFIQDPHHLYKHWLPNVWQAVEQHQPKPGMNELQVSFAIGVPDSSSNPSDELNTSLHYDNNGHPVTITFENGKATQITPDQAGTAAAH